METGKPVGWYTSGGACKRSPLTDSVSAHFRPIREGEYSDSPDVVGECWVFLDVKGTSIPYPRMTWAEWSATVDRLACTLGAFNKQQPVSH